MDEEYQQQNSYGIKKVSKQHNTLPLWGNEASMNLNPLILANIQGSSYFKVHLFKLKTYHEVVDEIYYQVKHLEPWERGSRKTSGQTGMCGGVRGVGAGGIVSTAFCLLYKLYTLRLTRKQVNGLLNHSDSPYIRALGFMYIRYTQPPTDLYDWYEDYLQDDEEIDVKAGGGQTITIGQMAFQFLTKLDWFSTLFPRIPVPIQKQIEKKLEIYCRENQVNLHQLSTRIVGAGCGTGTSNGASNNFANRGYDDRDYSYNSRGGSVREDYQNKHITPANTTGTTYRSEHDDRGNDFEHRSSSSHHRRRSPSSTIDRHENGREKHKKKHKRRERSRSRSRDRNRDRHQRKESPLADDYYRERERDRNKNDYSERRYR